MAYSWEYVQNNDLEGMRKYIESGGDINQADYTYGQTAVSWAAKLGYLEILKLLVGKDADVRIPDSQGMSPLHWAALCGKSEAVKILRAKGDVNQKTKDGRTPLHQAVRSRSSATISTLVEWMTENKDNLDPIDHDGRTPLYYATEGADSEIIKNLLEEGSNANGAEPRARPLIVAARQGNKDIIETLLTKRADLKLPDENGRPPLYWAARAGQAELAKRLEEPIEEPLKCWDPVTTLLLQACRGNITGDVQVVDDVGWTALHLAANIGHTGAINALLEAKSDINAKNGEGQSALILATRRNDIASVRSLVQGHPSNQIDLEINDTEYQRTALCWAASNGEGPMVEELLNMGSNANAVDGEGRSALVLAAINGKVSAITPLVGKKDTNLEMKDPVYERTALCWAASNGQEDAVQALVNAGSDINSLDWSGKTPLILAVMSGSLKSIKNLLSSKVSLDITDTTYKQSAVSYAAENGDKEIVTLLIKAGCCIYAGESQSYPPLERAASRDDFDLLRLFFDEKSDKPSSENPPRARAIEEALHHIYDNDYMGTIDLILAEKQYLMATDNDGRTVLSLAAESGHKRVTEALLNNPNVEPDKADKKKRTPLSWAAASGREAVVKQLLSIASVVAFTATKERPNVDKKLGSGVVDVNSTDDANWTPLWHAASNGHMGVTQALLKHGADPQAKNLQNDNLMKHLTSDKSGIETAFHNEIIKILEAYFPLLTESTPAHHEADKMFSAMSLPFLKGIDADLKPDRAPLVDLLSGQNISSKRVVDLRWLHLPANNMRWVEVLMTKHYEAYGDQSHRRRNLILNTKLWEDNEQIPLDKKLYHGRSMRPACHMLPFTNGKQEGTLAALSAKLHQDTMMLGPGGKSDMAKREKAELNAGDTESCHAGFVLFMPYLHWELEKEVDKLEKILRDKGGFGRARGTSQQKTTLTGKESNEAQALKKNLPESPRDEMERFLSAYIDEPHPLHIRRTLDQYYYPGSSEIDDRDKDQTVRRYYEEHHLKMPGIAPVLTMVDQLWMWVLPKYGQSPPTIITAFPQRSNRGKAGENPKWVSSLVASIIAKCGDLSSRSCYEVAEVIVAECSRFYLDSTNNRKEILQFREIYRKSIATIMDRDAARFKKFEKNLKMLNQVQGQTNSEEAISEILKELSDIAEDIEDLRQIKDIRDELNIMNSLFHVQEEVTEEMLRIIEEDKKQHGLLKTGKNSSSQGTPSPSSLQETVQRNLKQLKGLDDLAERAAHAINQLLELKQKQADLLLTKAIYKINDATDKQGKTVMTFTVVTIIFLPASFMASFLALEISQFPWVGDKLPLNWVLEVLLSISVPLTVTALAIAFSLSSQRITAFINRCLDAVKPYPVKVKSLLSERPSREKHVEEGLAV